MGSDGLPKVAAFELRERDSSLSVNWIEYFGEDRESSLQEIRLVIQINLRPNDRFAVLGVAAAKEAVIAGGGNSPDVFSSPHRDDPSHASISGYTIEDLAVAVELKALVTCPQKTGPVNMLELGRRKGERWRRRDIRRSR